MDTKRKKNRDSPHKQKNGDIPLSGAFIRGVSPFFLILLLILIFTSISHAQTLRTQDYTLKNPRIVITSGWSSTSNYTLTNAIAGSIFSGSSATSTYSIDVTEADQAAADTLAPEITSITPTDGTIELKGDTVNIYCEAEDNNLPLYFKTDINEIEKQPWSLTPDFNWDTSSEETGIKTITTNVKDIARNKTEKSTEVYLIRKPLDLPQ